MAISLLLITHCGYFALHDTNVGIRPGSIRAISAVIEVSLDRSPVLFGAAPCAQGIMKHRHAIVAHLPRLPLM